MNSKQPKKVLEKGGGIKSAIGKKRVFQDVNLATIPKELQKYPNWVNWRLENRDGKLKKIPLDPKTRSDARGKTENWGTSFPKAVNYWKTHKEQVKGIGFVFTNSPFSGIDLDNCRDLQTGAIASWAAEIVAEVDSYTEITPSGGGLHIVLQGDLPPGRRRKGDIEMYQKGHYFTVTGRHLEGTPMTIKPRGKELRRLHSRIFGPVVTAPAIHSVPFKGQRFDLSDSDLIEKAKQAKNGDIFSRLWSGDWSGHYSHSDADYHLCAILAFWTRNDPIWIDRLFRQSGLMRKKWDERRGGKTYGQITVQRMIEKTR